MAFSLNKIMLIGNIGRDAEHSTTPSQVTVSSFSLATTYSVKKDGNWVNETTWFNIKAFNLSDFYKENLQKGRKLYVEGRVSIREYTDKQGIKKYFTEVIAEKLIPLDLQGKGTNYTQAEYPGAAPTQTGPDEGFNPPSDEEDLPF